MTAYEPAHPTFGGAVTDVTRPLWIGQLGLIAILLTVTPSIAGVTYAIGGSGGSLYFTDILLPIAALAAFSTVARARMLWLPCVMTAAVIIASLVGLYHGASFRYLVRDARAPLYMVFGAIIGVYLYRDSERWARYMRQVGSYLGVMALLVLVSQLSSTALVGASQNDVLYYGGTAVQVASRRAQIGTDALALIVMCGVGGAFIAGADVSRLLGARMCALAFFSSLVILFVSYSRNTFIGIGAALGVAIVAPVGVGSAMRLRAKMNGLLRTLTRSTALIAVAAVPIIAILSSGVASAQLQSYEARVIQGLSPSVLSTDSSVVWRQTEDHLAFRSFHSHPWVGIGIGAFYRPLIPGEPFVGNAGRIYIHDYYLDVLVKGGILWSALVAVLLVGALVRFLYAPAASGAERGWRVIAACGLASILAVAFVAPWPNQTDGSELVGALVAIGWALPRRRMVHPSSAAVLPMTGQVAGQPQG